MHLREQYRASVQNLVESISAIRQKRRKELLATILSEELPTLPSYILELNTLLSSSSVDLKRVGKVIRNDPSLSAHVLRMCNSALFNLRRRVLSIEEAAVLMGAERLRTLVLTSSVMDFAGKKLSRVRVRDFWAHSLMTGMLSERIGQLLEYPEPEQAYLGGLLHDIGVLPLLIAARGDDSVQREMTFGPWGSSLEVEKDYFGTTHCEIGRSIGLSWNFFPSFIDVFENHHHPELSSCDRQLVGIIAAADHFCEFQSTIPVSETEPAELAEMDPAIQEEFLSICFPRLNTHDRAEIAKLLETEYLHLLPMVEMIGSGETPIAGR